MRAFIIGASLLIGSSAMAHEVTHADHKGLHEEGDGHVAIGHDGHVDHVHDGHLHHLHSGHADEHVIEVSAANPAAEAMIEEAAHKGHSHKGRDRNHPAVQHGDHFDRLHDGRLHHQHDDHIDDHGAIELI